MKTRIAFPLRSLVLAGTFAGLAALNSPAQTSPNLPVVTVHASDASASESGDPGRFTLVRNGPTNAALCVFCELGGTTSNGVDYATIPLRRQIMKTLLKRLQNLPGVAAFRQNAADFLFSGHRCGALPRRRYEALKEPLLILILLLGSLAASRATTTINKFAYGANLGWMDWRGDTNNGAVIGEYVCSGNIYSANVG